VRYWRKAALAPAATRNGKKGTKANFTIRDVNSSLSSFCVLGWIYLSKWIMFRGRETIATTGITTIVGETASLLAPSSVDGPGNHGVAWFDLALLEAFQWPSNGDGRPPRQ
jgi:hypothetical protein